MLSFLICQKQLIQLTRFVGRRDELPDQLASIDLAFLVVTRCQVGLLKAGAVVAGVKAHHSVVSS